MPIGISAGGLRLTTGVNAPENGRVLVGICTAALTGPRPMAINTSGRETAGAKQVRLVAASGAAGRKGYYGYSWKPTKRAGDNAECIRGVLIEGFTGVTPGEGVFVTDDTGTDTAFLTHTAPGTGVIERIGVGVSSTGIFFF